MFYIYFYFPNIEFYYYLMSSFYCFVPTPTDKQPAPSTRCALAVSPSQEERTYLGPGRKTMVLWSCGDELEALPPPLTPAERGLWEGFPQLPMKLPCYRTERKQQKGRAGTDSSPALSSLHLLSPCTSFPQSSTSFGKPTNVLMYKFG